MMVRLTATLHKYNQQGEKTGWTYVEIPADIAQQLKPGNKKEFKVKGKMHNLVLNRTSVMPVGGGLFILPVNGAMRKAIGKKAGAMVKLQLQPDDSAFVFNKDFIECLADDVEAKTFFETLPGSHQRYFSKWIDSAKTDATRIKRISMSLNALARKWGYSEMIRFSQGKPI